MVYVMVHIIILVKSVQSYINKKCSEFLLCMGELNGRLFNSSVRNLLSRSNLLSRLMLIPHLIMNTVQWSPTTFYIRINGL